MKYEFLPHTADIRMRISGSDPADLFNAGLRGMAAVLKGNICSNSDRPVKEIEISVTSSDHTALLIDFLSEVLTLSYTGHTVYCTARFSMIEEAELKGRLYGYPVDLWDEEIKAVTYTEARVHRAPDGTLNSNVVFDI